MTKTVGNLLICNIHKNNIKDYELLLHAISKLSAVDFELMVKAKYYLSNILENVIPNNHSIDNYNNQTNKKKQRS